MNESSKGLKKTGITTVIFHFPNTQCTSTAGVSLIFAKNNSENRMNLSPVS